MENLLIKLLNRSELNFRINTVLPNHKTIMNLLNSNGIRVDTWTPDSQREVEALELSFTENCNFRNIFILAAILKDFGLQYVYPSRDENQQISLGTYIMSIDSQATYAMAVPMEIDEFLKIDPNLDTPAAISTYFDCLEYVEDPGTDDDTDDDYESYDEDDYDYDSSHNDYERDSFDALTDGQYGDYDDWKENGGDYDSLRDGLGF